MEDADLCRETKSRMWSCTHRDPMDDAIFKVSRSDIVMMTSCGIGALSSSKSPPNAQCTNDPIEGTVYTHILHLKTCFKNIFNVIYIKSYLFIDSVSEPIRRIQVKLSI